MGKLIDMLGKKVGRLLVIGREPSIRGNARWLCRCDCGNTVVVYGCDLRSGNTQSCGCYNREMSAAKRAYQLTGQRFTRLIVDCFDHQDDNNNYIWKCICDCGNVVYAPSWALIAGHTRSCGCLQKDIVAERSAYDLIGQRFFRLIVEKRVGSDEKGQALWQCLCDCGNHTVLSSAVLVNGLTKSCGCLKSYGEQAIQSWLEQNNIKFFKEYRFNDCRNIEPLPFDFYLPNCRGGSCIEFDGEQHFEESRLYTEKVSLSERHRLDKIKTDYCESNHIPLLRIPYWEKDNIEAILTDWLFLYEDEEANSSDFGHP